MARAQTINSLSDLEESYLARTPRSRSLWEQATHVFPQGVSGAAKWFAPHPIFVERGSGALVWDVDGNEYVDLLMGAGPLLLGHEHPRIVEAVREQAARLMQPMMPTELSLALAERLQHHMPYLHRLRFTNTGSEANRTALRIARSTTGRVRFAKFEGGFHGSDDAFLVSTHTHETPGDDHRPQPVLDYAGLPPRLLDEALVLPYNDAQATLNLIDEHGDELAAVFMEPLAFSSGGGVLADLEFARVVREATRRHNIVLVLDEVVCALRLGLSGAPSYLGIEPDLSTIGKAIGGGLPLGAVGGRADLMEAALGAGAGAHKIFQSGTFTENPLSVAAGMAVLDVLETEPALERANGSAEKIRQGLRSLFAETGVTAAVTGYGSVFQVHLGAEDVRNRRELIRSDREATRHFLLGMVAAGVLWPPIHPAVTSAAHEDDHVDRVLTSARHVLESFEIGM